jgi:hypothetical protein
MISELLSKLKEKGAFKNQPELLDLLIQMVDLCLEKVRPANEVILDDVALCELMKISKRTSANWREKPDIKYTKKEGKLYYLLSDVLEMLEENSVKPFKKKSKIKL